MNDDEQINQLDSLVDTLVSDITARFGKKAVAHAERKTGIPLADELKETLLNESGFRYTPFNHDVVFALSHLHETAQFGRFDYAINYRAQNGRFNVSITEPTGVEINVRQDSLVAAIQTAHRTHHLLHGSTPLDDN